MGQMASSDSGAVSNRAIVSSRPISNKCGIGVNFKRLENQCMEVSHDVALIEAKPWDFVRLPISKASGGFRGFRLTVAGN